MDESTRPPQIVFAAALLVLAGCGGGDAAGGATGRQVNRLKL